MLGLGEPHLREERLKTIIKIQGVLVVILLLILAFLVWDANRSKYTTFSEALEEAIRPEKGYIKKLKITEETNNGSSLEIDNMATIHKILTIEDVRDVKLRESSSFHVPTYKIEALTSESNSDEDYFTLMTIGTDHTIWFGSGDTYEVKEKDYILLERIENVMNQE